VSSLAGIFPGNLFPAGMFPPAMFCGSGLSGVTQEATPPVPAAAFPALAFAPYATDEDVAVRCPGDYATLCPSWQQLASGSDGSFDPGSPWTLASASVDFGGQGLSCGNVVQLTGPTPTFKGAGKLFAVAAVNSDGSVTLRNIGLGPGQGQPAAPAAGLTGVTFAVPTFAPQIASCCLQLNHEFGLDPNLASQSPALVYDPAGQLRTYAVLLVLQRQYANEARGDKGDFPLKLKQVGLDLADYRSRLTVKFGGKGQGEHTRALTSTQVRR
jgi:hypothetical protein